MSEKKPVRREEDVSPRDLSTILKDAPPGAWVALSHDKSRIVAYASSMRAAAYAAQLKGEADPVLIKMPLEGEGIAAGVR
jgi:hypothetical protein